MQVFTEIIEHAKTNQISDPIVECPDLTVGQWVAQGDVNFIALSELPKNCGQIHEPITQLAPGTTRGSRHCIAAKDVQHTAQYRLNDPSPLHGIIFEAKQQITVKHPEHKWLRLQSGIYAVTFQRAFAEELRRVAD